MEINDSDAANLCIAKFTDSQSSIRSATSVADLDTEPLIVSENLSENLLRNVQNDIDTAPRSDREAHNDESPVASNSSTKESLETDIPKSMFHLSDNMKKDLSMLAFPSKSHARKKSVLSSRVMPNSRITIAEALEKAKDARKSMSILHKSSYNMVNLETNTSNLPSQYHSIDKIVDKKDKESQDVIRILTHSDASEQGKEKLKIDSAVTGKSVADISLPSDAAEEAASCSGGQTVSVGGKAKAPGTSRIQMTRRMCEVLKFTFVHEHFPSSVHMARLAKMMGLPWSQVRNWFTDRRVDNKKAGIYPRDKPLLHCPYCVVTLETEADQKSHLFSTHHVRRILGPEYCGGGTPESIKWKKLPKTVNAVSKMSGARILAVGFSAEELRKKSGSKNLEEEKKVEPAVEEVHNSKELKKLWTEAMLLPEEKEPPLVEWNSIKFNQENSGEKCESFRQRSEKTNLTTQDEKERNIKLKSLENLCEKKMFVSSRVGSISASASDTILGCTSATPNSSTLTSDMATRSSNFSHPVNTSVISEEMSRHPSAKKSENHEDISVTPELETSRKMTDFRRKLSMDSTMTESLMESQRLSTICAEAPQQGIKVTFPTMVQPMSTHTNFSSSPNSASQERLTKSSTFASQLLQDIELKQEPESDESWNHMNNITLYRADDSDAPEKCELAVVNADHQSLGINQSSTAYRPCSPRSSQLIQKSYSSVTYRSQIGKSGPRRAVNKASRTAADKRKLKLPTQALAIPSKANKANISVYEGNVIVGYQCPKCSKVYQTEWLMMKHSVTHFKYHCDICYQVYPDENMMKIHLLDHLSEAYEDEKYYCQFSCKVCHSLKCGCFEPTYCKPNDLPRMFFRPQKAKRSKRGFSSKLNSGPNDHLKISFATYKKLLASGGVGSHTGTLPSSKLTNAEHSQNLTLLNDAHKSTALDDSQIPNFALKETQAPNTQAEVQKALDKERDQESTKMKTCSTSLLKDKDLDASTGVQMEVRPNNNAFEEKDVAKREKQLNWNEVRTKFTFTPTSHSVSQPLLISKSTGRGGGKGVKRGGGRKRGTKSSKNFTYQDTDFYYMCEVCDASFATKSELSEHMFLHRIKSRSRRGGKRGISSELEERIFPKKMKVHNLGEAIINETVTESLDNYTCELCRSTFPTAADYRAHKILAHKEPKTDSASQSIEVYRCNYCDKLYRRRRELKRHLKRDCTSAPPSLKGALSRLSYSGNVIEDSHYTTLKIDLDDRSDTPPKPSGKCVKGPIVCKYCLAVTKREAEMKRHIWKFCLKVPPEIVRKFMDGASLEELGFKYIRDDNVSAETPDMDVSKDAYTEIPSAPNAFDEVSNTLHSDLSKVSSPKKTSPVDTKISPVHAVTFEESNSAEQCLTGNMETSVPPEASGNHSVSKIQLKESKKTYAQSKATATRSPAKHLPVEVKMESPSIVEETGESSTSTSPLASPVMQFPIVLPVMTASAKSKRPLVCGYCGIWYFREMAILKHMKERCIKIPELEKELLKSNPVLCNVTQKAGGGGIASENGAVYKMVKVPDHLQNTPVPMPKDVSNEDIKELNANINVFNENRPTTPAEVALAKEQNSLSSSSLVVREQDSQSGSSTAVKEQNGQSLPSAILKDGFSSSLTVVNEQETLPLSSTAVKEQGILSSSRTNVKDQDGLPSSSTAVKEHDDLSSSCTDVKDQDGLSSCTAVKEQDDLSSSYTDVEEQDDLSSSCRVVKGQDGLSSSTVAKKQDGLSSSTVPKKHDGLSSSSTITKKQDGLSSSSTITKKQDGLSSSSTITKKQDGLSSSSTVTKKQDGLSSSSAIDKKQDGLSSSSTVAKKQEGLSSSRRVVSEQDGLSSSSAIAKKHGLSSSSTIAKKQGDLSSPSTIAKKQEGLFSSSTIDKKQEGLSSSSAIDKKQDGLSSSFRVVKEQDGLSSSTDKEQVCLSASSTVVKGQDGSSSPATIIKEQDGLSSSSTVVRERDSVSPTFTEVEEQDSLSSPSPVVEHSLSSPASSPLKLNHNTASKKGSRCRRCHEHFRSQEAVLAHSSVHHGPKKGFYKCKLCHARLAKYKQLREHVWEHTDENPYRCHLCEVKYRSSDALVEHLHTQHRFTSIHEKNLYKWLPGRHGRYRDIKTKNNSCEEKLDDLDTSLDSLAEVMVITDKDICSKTATHSESKPDDNKATKRCELANQSVGSENMQERKQSLLIDSKFKSDNTVESNTSQEQNVKSSSGVKVRTDRSVCSNKKRKAVNKGMIDNVPSEDHDAIEKSLQKTPCRNDSGISAVLEESKGKGRTPKTDDLSEGKSERHIIEQNKITVFGEVETVDKGSVRKPQSGVDDDFSEEGLLPLVDNLDSIVETVHLTDSHLS